MERVILDKFSWDLRMTTPLDFLNIVSTATHPWHTTGPYRANFVFKKSRRQAEEAQQVYLASRKLVLTAIQTREGAALGYPCAKIYERR